MKITVVGKKGCVKCSKMSKILEDRGHLIEVVYIEKLGKHIISGKEINATEDTHFPLYIVYDDLFENYKDLMTAITPTQCCACPISEDNSNCVC